MKKATGVNKALRENNVLKIKSTIVAPNDKLAYVLRAKRKLIDLNNSKVNDPEHPTWYEEVYKPLRHSIQMQMKELRKVATIATPPVVSDGKGFSSKKDEEKYAVERMNLENSSVHDADIESENEVFSVGMK